jgi:Cu-Zn family superoxide dismutase
MGDLPNLTVGATGVGNMSAYTTRVTMGGPTGLFDADGSALVIHQNLDPLVPGPAGSGIAGGPRIACGVIER